MNEETEKIIRDTTIIYADGSSEWFEAIHLTKNGVIIERIINGTTVAYGFIPKHNIKEIKNGNRRI